MDNPGSFMSNANGGGSAIKAALQRRAQGGGTATIDQNTTNPQAPLQAPMPQGSGMPMSTPRSPMEANPGTPAGAMPMGGAMPATPESEIIVKALESRLKHFSKVEEAKIGMGGV